MIQYKHIFVPSGPWVEQMPRDEFARTMKSLDGIGAEGYRMVDYYTLDHFIVLVFEKNDEAVGTPRYATLSELRGER